MPRGQLERHFGVVAGLPRPRPGNCKAAHGRPVSPSVQPFGGCAATGGRDAYKKTPPPKPPCKNAAGAFTNQETVSCRAGAWGFDSLQTRLEQNKRLDNCPTKILGW